MTASQEAAMQIAEADGRRKTGENFGGSEIGTNSRLGSSPNYPDGNQNGYANLKHKNIV